MAERVIEVASGCLDHQDILALTLAYVFWPEEEERRRTYIVEMVLRAIGALPEISAKKGSRKYAAHLQGVVAEQLDAEGFSVEAVDVTMEMAADGAGELEMIWKSQGE